MAFLESQNLLAARTGLDTVFFQTFNDIKNIPGRATADTGELFHRIDIQNGAYIGQINKPVGVFSLVAESVATPEGTPFVTNTYTIVPGDYAQKIMISKDLFDDNMHSVWANNVKEFAASARRTMNIDAFNIFRNAFTGDTTPVLTADGVSLCNASHTLIGGGTVSNTATGVLNSTNLNTAMVALGEQKNQAGVIVGSDAAYLVVPFALFKTATELLDSALISDTANNAINVYRSATGITLYTSPYIGTAAGGTDTRWFLLTKTHSITRLVRQSVQTTLVNWDISDNRTYKYEANFRETYFVPDYAGVYGSTGTT